MRVFSVTMLAMAAGAAICAVAAALLGWWGFALGVVLAAAVGWLIGDLDKPRRTQ